MAITPAYVTVNPSFMEPGIILQYNQLSDAFSALADGQPLPRLQEGDLLVYIKRLEIRTKIASGQSAANQLPGIAIAASMISTPTYLQRVRAEYDHHDTAAAGRWGYSLPEAYRLGMRQAHFQLLRSNLLYGLQPQNGEGLLNTNGATTISLPPDSYGNTTLSTYDNGQLALYLLQQLAALKTRCNQLGIPRRFSITLPQRVGALIEYYGIVQLTSYQRPGAGSTAVAGLVNEVAAWSGDTIEWGYDDTLIGKGAGGADAILITMPEVKNPQGRKINTNEFARLAPGLDANTLQYVDMPAPREIPTPLAGGAIDVVSELRSTSGWAVRPEAITVISAVFQ